MSSSTTYRRGYSNGPLVLLLAIVVVSLLGCSEGGLTQQQRLRVATATSTRDSGLLERLLPPFEEQQNVRIDLIAVGTGRALQMGEQGEVDVLLVHARQAEDAFMAAGHGTRREDVMTNTFELLGPPNDPANIRSLEASAALQRIATTNSPFLSRGDDSGTHKREQQLRQAGGGLPLWPNFRESGQGMGATLTIADELQAYVLTDRGTYLHFRDNIDLIPLALQSEKLKNPYGVIVVNPKKDPAIRNELAHAFVDYLISPAAQQIIADYQLAGENLFVPMHLGSTKK